MKKTPSASGAASSHKNKLLGATLGLIAFVGVVGLGTVGLRHEISFSAEAHKRHQQRTIEVERRIAETDAQIAAALNPEVLLRQNTRLRLGLLAPQETQIVRVDEEVEVRLASKRSGEQFAASFVPASFVTFETVRR